MVIRWPKSRNTLVMSFRVRTAVAPDVLLITASPSSRLSPMYFLSNFQDRVLWMCSPTYSHISAPS